MTGQWRTTPSSSWRAARNGQKRLHPLRLMCLRLRPHLPRHLPVGRVAVKQQEEVNQIRLDTPMVAPQSAQSADAGPSVPSATLE